jgi:hypothetical protein
VITERHECRPHAFKQSLELLVPCAGYQVVVNAVDDDLVLRHFIVDIGFVELPSLELLQFRRD